MLRILKLKQVRWDPEFYPREFFDNATAKNYAKAMKMGEKFPSIVVAQIDKAFYLVDGLHRLKANELNGVDHVQVWVNKDVKSRKDLYVEAVRLNAKHGRALTRRDKEVIIKKLRELEVEEAEITKLILSPISDFKPVDYGKFRRSVGVRRPQSGPRSRSRDQYSNASLSDVPDPFSVESFVSSLDSVLSCLKNLDFSSMKGPDLARIKAKLGSIVDEARNMPALSSFDKPCGDDPVSVIRDQAPSENYCDISVGNQDDEQPQNDSVRLCEICGMVEVFDDCFVCGAFENEFPKID